VLGNPAGDPLAPLDEQQLGGLVDVLADPAEHRHRDEGPVGVPDAIDPDVVVVDELPQLRRDRVADLVDARQPAQPRTEGLDRLQLRGPAGQLGVVAGALDRDARLGRQGGHRLELVFGPRMGLVVVDTEEPEWLRRVAVEERHETRGVEALLDDRRPERPHPRVVRVADREDRLARGDCRGAQGRPVDVLDGADPRLGETPRRGHAATEAVRCLEQEDGGAVAAEQDEGVVDEAGQDLLEVESAADVAGDATQRVGPVDLV
jgi:hypothetical protein